MRIKGSHHVMRHRNDASRGTVVPVHAGKDIKRGLLRKIIADAGLTVDEFKALL
jgi:predicted RNA binding protein YcfA (HicA-like mRNA interferase family)